MRKFDTKVQHLKYKVLREVARQAWAGTLLENVLDIPTTIVPTTTPSMRCCVYKERAILAERVKLAMGIGLNGPNIIQVIDIACDECPAAGYEVTDSCRGCLAHRCEDVCKRGAISFDNNHVAHIDKSKCVECGMCAKVCPYFAIVNRSRPRLELAQKLSIGDVYVCAGEEDAVQRVMDETGNLGANVVFTANSSPASQNDALKMAINRARINFFGGLAKDLGAVPIDTNIIHYRELLVTGSHGATPAQHASAVEMIGSRRINVSKFRTQEFPLESILDAFKAAEDHTSGLRVIVKP